MPHGRVTNRVSCMPSAVNYKQVRGNECNKLWFHKCFSCHLTPHCCIVQRGHGMIGQQVNAAGFPLTSAQIYVQPEIIGSLNMFEFGLKKHESILMLNGSLQPV